MIIFISLTLKRATKIFNLHEQSDICLLCASKGEGHVGPIVIDSQLNISMQGVQFTSTIEVIGPSVIQLNIAGLRCGHSSEEA